MTFLPLKRKWANVSPDNVPAYGTDNNHDGRVRQDCRTVRYTASVWMSEMELVTLFDVIAPTLRAAIRSVYKSEVLQPCDVERRIRLPNCYYAEVYALSMVVALVFRINTLNATMVRNALLKRLCLRKDRQMLWLSLGNSTACKC